MILKSVQFAAIFTGNYMPYATQSSADEENITEAKELIKDIPGFKIELNDKIFVKFD